MNLTQDNKHKTIKTMHIHNMCRIKFLEFINSDTYDMPIACYKNSKLGAPPALTHNNYLKDPKLMALLP